jgi:hypothetical protein
MKKLILILGILSINVSFSQIQVNDNGFILHQYIRSKTDRIKFIETNPVMALYTMHGATRIYNETDMSFDTLQLSSNRLDSLLLNFPEFDKLSYRVKYVPQLDEFAVVIHESIFISKRFVILRKNKESYSIQFSYLRNDSGQYRLIFNYINFPDVYI